jgi:hypothetical protein
MAVYRIFPEQDTSIYSEYSDMNTGRDEILEVGSYYKAETGYVSRTLLQFNSQEVAEVLDTFVAASTGTSTAFSASLKMYLASANELPTNYSVEAWPIYVNGNGSWTVGNGKFGDLPRNSSGASWSYSGPGIVSWSTATYVTQSYSGSTASGGSWYTGSTVANFEATQSHPVTSTHDVDINVTEGVKAQYNGDIYNAGFIVKLADTYEFQTDYQTTLRYFSSDTHTIYPPCLEIKWDDSEYQTTLPVITDSNAVIKIKNNRGEYTDEGRQRFELTVRPKYPARTFVTSSNYLTNYRLPATSYWGLRDENTEEMVLDFDNTFTKISTSTSSSYFDVYMGGLEPERYYRVLVKTTINGSTNIIDENLVFKVVRNG